MVQQQTAKAPKVVRVIEPTISVQETVNSTYRAIRVAAYCRVSTKQEEQLNSYENQVKHYTDRINAEPGWILEGIYADKGITGTSYKKRDEFNRMIRRCKQGKIDMIIVKSIARFARNTVDCLKFVRMLRDLGVDVYFEEQGIHSNQPGAEFYITIYGCIAQSESENISANVRWGKAQSAKEGNVPFHYKNFLGYRKGADGKPEIDPDEAEIVRFIYARFLAGDSLGGIAQKLEDLQIPSPSGKPKWQFSTIQSILTNEKYKGDAIINKTYIKDCISKKVMINNGDRPKYYVENNHPAIIDSLTFSRVQEEIARRNSKKKVKQKGSKTEQGRYSSKYALTELLVCGECKTPYRRFAVVSRYNILVFGRDGEGNMTDIGTAETCVQDKHYYTLLERRTVDANGYLTIRNSLYRSFTKDSLGTRVPMSTLPQYADLQDEYPFTKPIGSVGLIGLRTPVANCVDGTADAVSVYAAAVGLIHNINRNEAQINGEFERGESRIIVSADMLRRDESGKRVFRDHVFVGLNEDQEIVGVNIFSPALREQSFLARKQEYLRNVENVIGLKRGLLSEVEAAERTATEITSSEGEYNLTIIDFQQMWEKTVREAVRVCGILGQLYKVPGAHEVAEEAVAIDWGNGVLFDEEKTWADYKDMVARGLLKPEIALGWRFNMPTKTEKDLEKIRKTLMPAQTEEPEEE